MKANFSYPRMLCPIAKLSFLLIFFILLFSSASFAQGVGKFSADQKIDLQSTGENIPYTFVFEKNENFKESLPGIMPDKYCQGMNTQLTTMKFDSDSNEFSLSIEKRMKPEWRMVDWNNYVQSLHAEQILKTKNQ